MTYDEIYNLRAGGSWLRNRVIVAIGQYASYLAGLGDGASVDQKAFVARVLPGANAEIEADYILWACIFDSTVQTSGVGMTDGQMDTLVQTLLLALGRVKAV